MNKETKNQIIDFILSNSTEEQIDKAIKNYNIQMLINLHQPALLVSFFNRDGIKFSEGTKDLFDEYLTDQDGRNAVSANLELRILEKPGKKVTDVAKKIAFQKKIVDPIDRNLELLKERFVKLNTTEK